MAILLNKIVTRAAIPARWLIVVAIAWTLANTVLYVASSPQGQQVVRLGANESSRLSQPAANLNTILSRNLFGHADAQLSIKTTEVTEETRLPLELQAVFVAEEVVEDSAAIVAQKGKPGLRYNLGDTIPGNAVLVAVFPKHIILRRAGTREKLTFPTNDGQFQKNQNRDPAPTPIRTFTESPQASVPSSTQSAREFVSAHQERMESNPEEVLDELGISPVSADSAAGYQLGNLAQSPYLSQTGLQPGDVILSVNGRPVGDMQADRLEIANVLFSLILRLT